MKVGLSKSLGIGFKSGTFVPLLMLRENKCLLFEIVRSIISLQRKRTNVR